MRERPCTAAGFCRRVPATYRLRFALNARYAGTPARAVSSLTVMINNAAGYRAVHLDARANIVCCRFPRYRGPPLMIQQ